MNHPLCLPLKYFGNRLKESSWLWNNLLKEKSFGAIYEPFCGSGAFSFIGMNLGIAERFVLNDSYEPLIQELKALYFNHEEVIDTYAKHYNILHTKNNKHCYYESIKDGFNKTSKKQLGEFLFLSNFSKFHIPIIKKTSYSSLLGSKMEPELLPSCIKKDLQKMVVLPQRYSIEISSGHFVDILKNTTTNDLVFLDPPYPDLPATISIYHNMYNPFTLYNQLCQQLTQLNAGGTPFILFYGLFGIDKRFILNCETYQVRHFILYNSDPSGPFKESLEHLYISNSLAECWDNLTEDNNLPIIPYEHIKNKKTEEALLHIKFTKNLQASQQDLFNEQPECFTGHIVINKKIIAITPREYEVLKYLKKGYSAKQTAREMNLSTRTIEAYLDNVKKKTGARTKFMLLRLLTMQGFEGSRFQ